jgi:hypothetical protein
MNLKVIIRVIVIAIVSINIQCLFQDRVSPSVYFVYPQENSNISGAVRIKVVATDNKEIEYVEFYVGNLRKGVDSTATASVYEYNWDSSFEGNGEKVIRVVAYDRAGNRGEANIKLIIQT